MRDHIAQGSSDHLLARLQAGTQLAHLGHVPLKALTIALALDIPGKDISAACASFSGVARRFEILTDSDQLTIVDDYAHHPTEIAAVIAAARQAYPDRRLVALFQPHLYSRTRDFAVEFGRSLGQADAVVVLPIYPAREPAIAGVTSALVSRAVPETTQQVSRVDNSEVVQFLRVLL